MFFSKIAIKEKPWDAELGPAEMKEWLAWIDQLPKLKEISIPRAIKVAPVQEAELHVFADASGRAYAAAAYAITVDANGSKTVRLVAAKAHAVQPDKLSIPRLELLAAELSVRLRKQVLQALKLQVGRVYHWSDSKTALYWILNDKRRLQTFVHNRVQKILKESRKEEWHWTPTDQNPADFPTRGWTVQRFLRDQQWLQGPSFLQGGVQVWPCMPELQEGVEETKEMKKAEQAFVAVVSEESTLQFQRFSSWGKIWRILHRILCWRDRARERLGLERLESAWKRAEVALIRQAQKPIQDLLATANRPQGGGWPSWICQTGPHSRQSTRVERERPPGSSQRIAGGRQTPHPHA